MKWHNGHLGGCAMPAHSVGEGAAQSRRSAAFHQLRNESGMETNAVPAACRQWARVSASTVASQLRMNQIT